MLSGNEIDHLIRDLGLVLLIIFVVPIIAAIAGIIAANASALQASTKGTGRQNG